jgi:site-specific recombinase XerD
MKQANVIQFPINQMSRGIKRERTVNIDGIKYFNAQQIKMIRRRVRDQAEIDHKKGNITGIKEWMVIDLLTSTGVRVSEAANLRCGDLRLGYGESSIFVRKGKGDISGHVVINESLKKHFKSFMGWKNEQKEPIGEESYVFIGQRGPWTSQAIQQIVKKYLKDLNLYQKGKSVHALRHSYAVELYSKEKDIRAVQKQLRHVSLQSTLVYADVTEEAIKNQVKGLWN